MSSVVNIILNVTNKSDVAFGSRLYEEITHKLTDIGLNLAFFVFTTSEHSSCARNLNGNTISVPALTLFLKYIVDLEKTGIDPHLGNWDDKWAQTRTIRDVVNAVMQRHGLDENYVTDHTFVFVRTLEELAFREIGRECKNAVKQFVCDQAPGVAVSQVFWNGQQFHVIMKNKADFKRVKRDVKAKVTSAIPRILAAADRYGDCQNYKAAVEFGYTGMSLFHLIREEL